jgi:acyl-CoA synthetase (NDP forming)
VTQPHRPLYGSPELAPLIRPRSIAVVGASPSGRGFGSAALRELAGVGFDGPLYAVNPRIAPGEVVLGVPGLASIADLPNPVDCVLVAIPAGQVATVVEEAAVRGCRSTIVFSAGFSEAAGGEADEAALARLAAEHGIRIGGPNTAGILNYRDRLPLTFVSDLRMDLPAGNLGIVSQSAGIATHLGHVRHRGAGVSYTITTGNSADVNAFDYVNFLLDDDATDVVALALEGIDNPWALPELGRRARLAGKPILVLKGGRTGRGSQAAVSHTGSLAGSYDVFLTAAEEAGLLVCRTTEELIETALLFAKWAGRPYRDGGVAILTTMGGPGVLAADAAEDHAVNLPVPSAVTTQRLGELMPSFAAVGNPVDTTAFRSDDVLTESLRVLAEDESFAAVVMLAATTTGAATAGRPGAIARAAADAKAPLCAVWLSSWLEGPGSELLDASPDLPVFRSTDRCLGAIARWQEWHRRELPGEEPAAIEDGWATPPPLRARIDAALASRPPGTEPVTLDEYRSAEILADLGVRFPTARLVTTAAESAAAAIELGTPVVAKVVSGDVAHKAKVGGVVTGLADPEATARAFTDIMAAVRTAAPGARLDGVLVAEMVPAAGPELMCGLVRDPVFGPVAVCGAGGSAVEETGDVARCLAPVTTDRALRAIRSLRVYRRRFGTDAAAASTIEAELARVMIRLARFALDEPRLREVDLNPVVLHDGQLLALDALMVVG